MDFDQRLILAQHVEKAILRYKKERPEHRPARSAFLISDGEKLPAKMILRLAFQEATGVWVRSETLTGGRASVKVLTDLGFNAVYEKPVLLRPNRSPIKCVRRAAFARILAEHFGKVLLEQGFPEIVVPDLQNRDSMPRDLRKILEKIESVRQIEVKGGRKHKLKCDLYLADHRVIIEYDERQHFTPLRAASLKAYPKATPLAFDSNRWMALSESIRAGDNSPIYRDEQRAFYDSVRDILAPQYGYRPVVRVFEEDVAWESENADSAAASKVLAGIRNLIGKGR